MKPRTTSILFVTRDPLPPTRPDVKALFGCFLPRLGILSDIVGPTARRSDLGEESWPAGRLVPTGHAGGMRGEALKALGDLRAFRRLGITHDIVQVRDRTVSALVSWWVARYHRKPFVYWMSFPIVEGYEARAREVGFRQGFAVWVANRLRAVLARQAYYGWIARRADHLFVQSDVMLDWMHREHGIARSKMTAVPMGVDTESLAANAIVAADEPRLTGRRVLIYLGTLALAREPGFMLDLVDYLRCDRPDVLLVLAGDGVAEDEKAWLRGRIADLGLENHVWLTGWLPQARAMALVKAAEIGLSPIPRGPLFDVSSPTKALEYLALGVPCVGNDIPDQRYVLEQSGAGVCVPMTIRDFAAAIGDLLDSPERAREMGLRGPAFIARERSYGRLAEHVAQAYRRILAPKEET